MITVREFQESDAGQVSEVYFYSFQTYLKERMETDAPHPGEYWLPMLRRLQNESYDNITFVAEEDGKIIGAVSITAALKRGLGSLQRIGVLPECAGKGVGKLLFQEADKFWKEHKMRKVATCVSSINPTALKFYQRCGFHIEGTLKDHFFDGVDEYQLALFYPKADK